MDGRMPTSRRNVSNLDGDVDDATFLRYSGNSAGADQRLLMLQEREKIESRTLASTQRSLQLLHDSESVGSATAEELTRQREQLENTEQKLDEINASLRISERHIQSIKSVFGSIKNYFSGSKDLPGNSSSTSSSQAQPKTAIPKSKSGLGEVLENSQRNQAGLSSPSSQNPFLTNEHGSRNPFSTDDYGHGHGGGSVKTSASVDEMLDKNLDDMSSALGRLKGLGRGLGEELDSQNILVERITNKAEDADFKIVKQSKDMNKILKK